MIFNRWSKSIKGSSFQQIVLGQLDNPEMDVDASLHFTPKLCQNANRRISRVNNIIYFKTQLEERFLNILLPKNMINIEDDGCANYPTWSPYKVSMYLLKCLIVS